MGGQSSGAAKPPDNPGPVSRVVFESGPYTVEIVYMPEDVLGQEGWIWTIWETTTYQQAQELGIAMGGVASGFESTLDAAELAADRWINEHAEGNQ